MPASDEPFQRSDHDSAFVRQDVRDEFIDEWNLERRAAGGLDSQAILHIARNDTDDYTNSLIVDEHCEPHQIIWPVRTLIEFPALFEPDGEFDSAQFFSSIARLDTLESNQQSVLVPAGVRYDQGTISGAQHRTRIEVPEVLGEHSNRNLSPDPVRPTDAADR